MENSEIEILIYSVSIILFAIGFFLFAIYFIFKKKQRKSHLRIIELNQELLKTQIEIQEQTLTNISQELHDNIGQSLSLAKLNLNTLKPTDLVQSKENIDATKTLISNALTNIRDLAKSMLGEKITEIGLEQAVRNEVKLLQQSGKYQVNFRVNNEPEYQLSAQQELVAFRILQEAIHNIVKHANATNIDILFSYDTTQTTITISDNGKGFVFNELEVNETGVGMKNMQNRAALINAKLNIQSAIFQGTSLTLSINR